MNSKPTETQSLATNLPLILAGAFLGTCLLKFGTPVILDHEVATPESLLEFQINPWPIRWAYLLLGLLGLAFIIPGTGKRFQPSIRYFLPLAWFAWLWISAGNSQPELRPLTAPTLDYFAATVFCFYLGSFLSHTGAKGVNLFWAGILIGFVLMLRTGFIQHFGGLEETRKHFFLYILPKLTVYPTEFLAKISSNRIFGTLFYPNGLAGGILLFLPACLGFLWRWSSPLRPAIRWSALLALGMPALACLYWSGSKAGWLIFLMQVALTFLHLRVSRPIKLLAVGIILVAGLFGFFFKYQAFFQKGATSVSARFIYWKSALQIASEHPILGTGPGTFGPSFARIKPAGAEMARLAHNDYLQQASDSGWPAFSIYLTLILWLSYSLYRKRLDITPESFGITLGLFGWISQSFVEFGLYIPALGWGAFFFFGWLYQHSIVTTKNVSMNTKPIL